MAAAARNPERVMPSSSAALSMSRSTRGAKVIFTRTGFSGWGSTGTSWYKVPSGTSISSSRQCASALALAAARPEGTGRGVPRSASTSSQPVAASCAASKASCSVSPKVLQPSRSGKNTQNVPSSCGKNCAM